MIQPEGSSRDRVSGGPRQPNVIKAALFVMAPRETRPDGSASMALFLGRGYRLLVGMEDAEDEMAMPPMFKRSFRLEGML